MAKCGTCGREENFPAEPDSELRPYGPDGEDICFKCAFADEEAEKRTQDNFAVQFEAAAAISPIVTLGPNGPDPYVMEDED